MLDLSAARVAEATPASRNLGPSGAGSNQRYAELSINTAKFEDQQMGLSYFKRSKYWDLARNIGCSMGLKDKLELKSLDLEARNKGFLQGFPIKPVH